MVLPSTTLDSMLRCSMTQIPKPTELEREPTYSKS